MGSNPRRCYTWGFHRKFKKELSTWKEIFLSIRGRLTLLNSIFNNIPIYFISFFDALVKGLHEIFNIHRKFLWDEAEEKKRITRVKLSCVCKSKKEEWLCVNNVKAFNKTLMSKWKWRMLIDHQGI